MLKRLRSLLLVFGLWIRHYPTLVKALSIVVVSNNTNTIVEDIPESVVLFSDEFLEMGQYRYSPGNVFRAGLSTTGDFVVEDLQHVKDIQSPLQVWSAGAKEGYKLHLQKDGNLIIRDVSNNGVWDTNTHRYPSSQLVLNDAGQIAISHDANRLWVGGLPRDYYNHSQPTDMDFPIRATFYYPWYPETFTVDGNRAHYEPSLGWYSSSSPDVAKKHIESMDYAHIGLSIASWWGPDTHLDRARMTMLMDKTVAMDSPLRWTVYFEREMTTDPTISDIQQDLSYLMHWLAKHPAWAYKDGKPIIFVYNENAGCDIARKWMQASNNEWYVVLKVFQDHENCAVQPDSFHQYGSGDNGVVHNKGYSFVVSPGFWHARSSIPRIPRISPREYCENVKQMKRSREPWQLVLSFNEAGEGTMIESSPHWQSRSGYGKYLDCLHGVPSAASHWIWQSSFFATILALLSSFPYL